MIGRRGSTASAAAAYRGHLMSMLTREVRSKLDETDRLGNIVRRRKEVIIEAPEDEEEEEEVIEPVMTREDRKAVVKAVIDGDIDLVDHLLDKPGADINMTWYNENLLLIAIRAGQSKMAEFLIDSGVDRKMEAIEIELSDRGQRQVDVYRVSARQMAYDAAMWDLLQLMDHMDGTLWSFITPRPRSIRRQGDRRIEQKPPGDESQKQTVRGQLEETVSESRKKAMSSGASLRLSSATPTAKYEMGAQRLRSATSMSTIAMETFSELDDTMSVQTFATTHGETRPIKDKTKSNVQSYHRYKSTKGFWCRRQALQESTPISEPLIKKETQLSKPWKKKTSQTAFTVESRSSSRLGKQSSRSQHVRTTAPWHLDDPHVRHSLSTCSAPPCQVPSYKLNPPLLQLSYATQVSPGLSRSATTLALRNSHALFQDFQTVANKLQQQKNKQTAAAERSYFTDEATISDTTEAMRRTSADLNNSKPQNKNKTATKNKFYSSLVSNANPSEMEYSTLNHTLNY